MVIHYLHILQLILQNITLDYYRDKDCMKIFCKELKEHATKIINYGKTK